MLAGMVASLIQRRCPLCDAGEAGDFLTKPAVRLVRCRACSMVYANPVEADLATGSFYDRKGTSFYLSPEKLQSDYASVRFARELRLFRKYCRQGEVLDVGCSTGGFLFQLKTRFPSAYQVTGMDVTSTAVDYAESRGINVLRGSMLDLKPEGHCFDSVTFWAVLEHLVEPRQFLEQARELLEAGGFCFILVPNLASLAVRVLGAKYRYIMPDHVNYFSPSTLLALARSVQGFEVVHVKATHFNPIVLVKDLSSGTGRVRDEERARLLKQTTAWKQSTLLRPASWLYAGLEFALAQCYLADNIAIVLRKS
jgi:2-polyprenyl-3-methyl-5-hydroxy-6-metoxy-1,4-benzoquinol methylase